MPADKKLQERLVEEFGKRYLDRVELPQYFYTSSPVSRRMLPLFHDLHGRIVFMETFASALAFPHGNRFR